MKHYPPRIPRKPAPPIPRIPPFYTVPARARRDGWTPRRQAQFIGHLAETRSVTEAARRVSMARETAYRLRARPWADSFATAWDAAMLRPAPGAADPWARPAKPKVTNAELIWRVESGLWQVRMYRRKFVAACLKPDESTLLRLLARFDRADAAARTRGLRA